MYIKFLINRTCRTNLRKRDNYLLYIKPEKNLPLDPFSRFDNKMWQGFSKNGTNEKSWENY